MGNRRREWELALSVVRPRFKFGSQTKAEGLGCADRADHRRSLFWGLGKKTALAAKAEAFAATLRDWRRPRHRDIRLPADAEVVGDMGQISVMAQDGHSSVPTAVSHRRMPDFRYTILWKSPPI